MTRYLVVANQTLGSAPLAAKVEECLASGPSSFFLMVPATPRTGKLTFTEGEVNAAAAQNLEKGLSRFREMGADAEGAVGDPDPLQAIGDLLGESSFDAIIISTLPERTSKWLRQDLPTQVERSFNLPVTHVVAEDG